MKTVKLSLSVLMTVGTIAAASIFALTATAQPVPPLINYQGRLTDQTGAPLQAGSYTIQFRLWDSATNSGASDLIWGQQQNLTVQSNGVFNVILGSPGGVPIISPTPTMTNLAYAFAGPNCFLGVTVAAGPSGVITNPSEILPRQQLLSVPFAFTAAVSSNSTFAASVAPGSITALSLAANAVQSANIAPGAVQTVNIAAGAVTLTNLAPRQMGTIVGALAISGSSGPVDQSRVSNSSFGDVTNLSITLNTSGRPVYIGLVPDGTANASYLKTYTSASGAGSYMDIAFIANHSDGSMTTNLSRIGGVQGATVPPGAFFIIDQPPNGSQAYKVQATRGGNDAYIYYVKLIAYEL